MGASISSCSIILFNDYINEQTGRKDKENKNNIDKRIIISLKNDLRYNTVILKSNIHHIRCELKKGEYTNAPLKEFKSSFLELIKLNIPKELENPIIFNLMIDSVVIMESCNEQIRLKENYKIMNIQIENDIIKEYNKSLMKSLEYLSKILRKLFELLDYDSLGELLKSDTKLLID